jgi:hypothetical protein
VSKTTIPSTIVTFIKLGPKVEIKKVFQIGRGKINPQKEFDRLDGSKKKGDIVDGYTTEDGDTSYYLRDYDKEMNYVVKVQNLYVDEKTLSRIPKSSLSEVVDLVIERK